jgi:Alkylmercury lyase
MTHPFSAVPTPYRVQCGSGSTSYWANCAWDAFGIAAILGRDTECICRCPDCHQRMDLSVKRGSVDRDGIVHFVVPPRRFWDNVAYT